MTKKPRILVDARMVGSVSHGIGNYVLELAASSLLEEHPYSLEFLVGEDLPACAFAGFTTHVSDIPFLSPREILGLASVLKKIAPDLYHTPSFSSLLRYPCPHIQTVHDLNHLHFGSLLQKIYYRLLLLPSVKSAKAVVTVSESVSAELKAWLGAHGADKKIEIARNVIADLPAHGAPPDLKEYFFVLSNSKPHKNLLFLEKAYLAARARKTDLPQLVMNVDGKSENGILRVGALGASDMIGFLSHARGFFFPSLYEGFGRPPVEAALAGVKPVVSDIPVLREALAGVSEAVFLDPRDESAWTAEFLRGAEKVSEKSRAWIRSEYSLARLGETMEKIYRAALI